MLLSSNHLLVDVRDGLQFDILHFRHALHAPLKELRNPDSPLWSTLEGKIQCCQEKSDSADPLPVVVYCRRGVSSRAAARLMQERWASRCDLRVLDLLGGLEQWSRALDSSLPIY